MPMDGSSAYPIVYLDTDGERKRHYCKGTLADIKDWLDRQIVVGGVSSDEAKLVERLIEDIR